MDRATNLNDMMVFLAVVEQGSFTLAGDKLGIPKSNISRRVSRLEEGLGTRLLQRTTRSLHLTEIGEAYYRHCQRIQEEINGAYQCVEMLSSQPVGRLSVCASVTIGQAMLSAQLADFHRLYPQVVIDLQLTNRRVDIIEEGFDVVLRVGESPDSSLISKRLFQAELSLYAAPQYIEQARVDLLSDTAQPTVLADESCLWVTAMSDKPQWQLTALGHTVEQSFEPRLSCNDFEVAKQVCIGGMGVAMLPDYICQHALANNQLQHVMPGWQGRQVNIYAVYANRKAVTPKVRTFIDFLAAQWSLKQG